MNNIVKFVKNNRSTILITLGIVGGTIAAIKAVKDTPKAIQLIEMKKDEMRMEKLPPKELILSCWKVYAPSVLMGVLSASCIVFGQRYTSKELIGMTAVYGATASDLQRYKNAVNTVATPEVAKAVKNSVAKQALEENKDKIVNSNLTIVKDEEYLCFESFTGQLFKANPEKIKQVEIKLNDMRISDDYVCMSNLAFEFDGLQDCESFARYGWKVTDGKIKLECSDSIVIDGKPCLYLSYSPMPRENFDSVY